MKKKLTMSFLLLVSSLSCPSTGSDAVVSGEIREFPAGSFSSVEAHSDNGRTEFIGDSGPIARVSWSKRTSDVRCNVGATVEGGVLKLVNKKLGGGTGCTVDWEVRIPHSVPVSLKLGVSETKLSDLTGEVSLDVGVGKLVSDAPLSKLTVKAGQLDGSVSDLAGDSTFDLGSGRLNMAWRAIPPFLRTMSFDFGNGSAVVTVPDGSTVNLDGLDKTPGGFFGFGGFTKLSEVPSSDAPNFRIIGGGGSGSIEVKKTI